MQPKPVPTSPALTRSVRQTKVAHMETPYFENAEGPMHIQWSAFIEPRIRGGDFSTTLDLACGHGRNAAKLLPMCREMYLVDVNDHCIEACRRRFAGQSDVLMHYHVNDGYSLPFIPDGKVTFVYSWDAMVHFDTVVVEQYIHEFARIMAPGARGFIHHSNYGEVNTTSNWRDNPHWRSNTSHRDVIRYLADAGLEMTAQEIRAWGDIANLDGVTRFRKPA